MDTVVRTLLPRGSLWEPKEFELEENPVELITNGTFDTDLAGWTTFEDPLTDVSWLSNTALLFTNGAA